MSQQESSKEIQEISALFREIVKRQKEAVEAQPYTILIQNLRHPSYRLRHPIPVLIERDDDRIIAIYHDVDMFDTGADVQEALSALCAAIIKYYETLKDNEENTGSLPSQAYAFLKHIIVEVENESIKPDPWLEIRGMFADDPHFDDFVKEIEAYRKEVDEAYWKEVDNE